MNNVQPDTAERLVAFTRQAYANSDPVPGLPAPDGSTEGVRQLLRFLDDGGSVQVARTDNRVVGLVRTSVLPDGALWVSRVAVAPWARGRGVGAELLVRVEGIAAVEGFRVVRLDAVIERCLVPYYARLGYRVVAYHPPDDGRPLTEAGMERDLALPRQPMPYRGPDPGASRIVAWYATAAGTTAVVAEPTDRSVRHGCPLGGLDAWLGDPEDLPDLLCTAPGARPTGDPCVVDFPFDRNDIPLHVCPRMSHDGLWALVRFRPGDERTMSDLHTRE
ncbi:MAG TPA: GNAT family N-acetyltransferase [Pseudonocardiaceae bacterium]|nr:GNAT family N-acetyltransferase [Pseudonocardiaceae bacterium]